MRSISLRSFPHTVLQLCKFTFDLNALLIPGIVTSSSLLLVNGPSALLSWDHFLPNIEFTSRTDLLSGLQLTSISSLPSHYSLSTLPFLHHHHLAYMFNIPYLATPCI